MFETNKEGKGGRGEGGKGGRGVRGVRGKEVGGISNTQLKDKTIALLNI